MFLKVFISSVFLLVTTSCALPHASRKCTDGGLHGSVRTGYLKDVAPKALGCKKAKQKCVYGAWKGPKLYNECKEIELSNF